MNNSRLAPGNARETKIGPNQVSRSSYCPKHPAKLSNRFIGVTVKGWVFKCTGEGGHDFVAAPAAKE